MRGWLGRFAERYLGLDLRSLALLRICLGGCLLLDLLLRSRDLQAHYTDWGVLPRSALFDFSAEPWWLCLHTASGKWQIQAVLFALHALCAAALLTGYRTRCATFFSWLLLISLHARNPMVLNSGDVLLRALLFWGIFLPWGSVWSYDARSGAGVKSLRCLSLANLAYLLQLVLLYAFAAHYKSGLPWWEGSAIYYTLSLDQFTSVLGHQLLLYPKILNFLTWSVLFFQMIVPILLLTPIGTGTARALAVWGLAALHLGIGLTMHLGIFTPVAMVAAVGLLPTEFWSRFKPPKKLRVVVDELPSPNRPRLSRIENLFLAVMLGYVVLWNFQKVPLQAHWVAQLFQVDQRWDMFAPQPMVDDGWFVVTGTLKNGRTVDLFRQRDEVTWDKPELVSATFPNQRWRKYMMNLYLRHHRRHRALFAAYVARRWNRSHSGSWKVERVQLYFILERTLPDYQVEPSRRLLLHEHLVESQAAEGEGFRTLFPSQPKFTGH